MNRSSIVFSRLLGLPNELLLCIATYLSTQHLSSLARCNKRLVQLLNNEVYKSDPQQMTALRWGAAMGLPETVSRSFEAGANIEGPAAATALTLAAEHGHRSVVQLILDLGVDVNLKSPGGTPPVIWAASNGHDSIVRLLIEAGANVEESKSHADSALIWAVYKGHEKVVELLLEAGANIESKSLEGTEDTPLIIAVQLGYEGVVKVLLEKGANPESADNTLGLTPLSWTVVRGNKAMAESLLQHGAKVNSEFRHGLSALMHAAYSGNLDIAKLLIEKGAFVLARDSDGRTALSLAVEGHDTGIGPEGRKEVIRLLVKQGATAEPQERELAELWAIRNGILDLL